MIATINGFTISTVKASPGTSYHRLSRQRARDMVLSRMGSNLLFTAGICPVHVLLSTCYLAPTSKCSPRPGQVMGESQRPLHLALICCFWR